MLVCACFCEQFCIFISLLNVLLNDLLANLIKLICFVVPITVFPLALNLKSLRGVFLPQGDLFMCSL